MSTITHISTLENIHTIAKAILDTCIESKIFLFKGNLGAGKTTLINSICKSIGVENEISSPTYSIINEYKTSKSIVYHMDLYRLKSEEEALDLDIFSYLDSNIYCFIEWPEIIQNYLHDKYYIISIETLDVTHRTITCQLYNGNNIQL